MFIERATKKRKRQFTARIEVELLDLLKLELKEHDISMSAFLKGAILEFLEWKAQVRKSAEKLKKKKEAVKESL